MGCAMDREAELDIIRRAYAKQVMAKVSVDDPSVEKAFAEVHRENFLGEGPWQVLRWYRGYVATPSADPVYLYTDDLVGIIPERKINNGQPSLHAWLMAQAAPRQGEHVVHVGAGVGYYTAILAHLTGRTGKVTAIEYDADLAALASSNLKSYSNTVVIQGDGSTVDFAPADVIYVNAGATRPADSWLDRLRNGGRLILPLTTDKGFNSLDPGQIRRQGAVFRIERQGCDFRARWIGPVAIFPCEGLRDAASEAALAAALEKGGWETVTGLHRGDDISDQRCWLRAPGWCLTRS
jgi:protein-L-isoaspartate(D-aspartate) O-methyltransferase